ncbi:MAG: hypothetical protein ACR2MW_08455 [Chthoniobacterales bacterium]
MIFPLCGAVAMAQEQPNEPPVAPPAPTPFEESIKPTFETQKQARTYILDIPAPRGQITDRNGVPLAQNRLSYNLTIDFPTPLDFSDAKALDFAHENIRTAERLLSRSLEISDAAILRHYHNRGFLPLEIAQDLKESEREELKSKLSGALSLKPIYQRIYPQGALAGALIGYTGRTSRNADGIIQNGQLLWP